MLLLDTKNKKIIFAMVMLVLWGTAGVVYAIKNNLLYSIVSFAVVLGMGVKLYNIMKDPNK